MLNLVVYFILVTLIKINGVRILSEFSPFDARFNEIPCLKEFFLHDIFFIGFYEQSHIKFTLNIKKRDIVGLFQAGNLQLQTFDAGIEAVKKSRGFRCQ